MKAIRHGLLLSVLTGILAMHSAGGVHAQTPSPDWQHEILQLSARDPSAAIAQVSASLAELPDDAQSDRVPLLLLRGAIRRDSGDHEAALEDVEQIRRSLQSAPSDEDMARSIHLEASILAEQGQSARAIERLHNARRLIEANGPSVVLTQITIALGVTYNFLDNKPRARVYMERALDMAKAIGNANFELTATGNLAVVLADLDEVERSLDLHYAALALARQQGNTVQAGYQLANLCNRHMTLQNPDTAESYCREALAILENSGRQRILSGLEMTLGDLAKARGETDEALSRYTRALTITGDTVLTVQADLYLRLRDLHSEGGRLDAALHYANTLLTLREELRERERDELIEELEVRYAVEQTEAQIEMLRLSNVLQSAQLTARNRLLVAMLAGLLITACLLLWIWRSHQRLRRLRVALSARNHELETAVGRISELADRDPLTGLLNRRALYVHAAKELSRAKRSGQPVCVALGDIDHFKLINDRFGHAVGDTVLTEFARRLQVQLRDIDLVARWGGEEFLCMLTGNSVAQSAVIVERVRSALTAPISTTAGNLRVEVTFGVAAVEDSLEQAIQRADHALYSGKQAGRNRVILAEPTAIPAASGQRH